MLELQNVCKTYDHPVIRGFSYVFPDKGLFLIRGASGSGKTTLLRLIGGLEQPDSGLILRKEPCRISYLFQEPRLVPHLTLLENVLLVKKEKDKTKASQILSLLGLGNDEKKYPSELSGGMKLRGSVARSLYYGGDLYLWDEPTDGLDEKNRDIIIQILKDLSKKSLVVTVTHDASLPGENVIEL